ncbi:hypothetical protein ABKN59_009833 [Abortiporus biennis]
MLTKCQNLKKLSFISLERDADFDESVTAQQRFLPSQLTLEHLHSLTIDNVGGEAYTFILGLRAPLRFLSLEIDLDFEGNPGLDFPDGIDLRDPVPVLVHFSSTLEEIVVIWADWQVDWQTCVQNKIRCHSITTHHSSIPDIASFMYMFPNLKKLEIFDDYFHDIEERRNFNIQSQSQFANTNNGLWNQLSWEDLTLDADPQSLYGLAISKGIHALYVGHCQPEQVALVKLAIQSCIPNILNLELPASNHVGILKTCLARMTGMFQYHQLRSLSLRLPFSSSQIAEDTDRTIENGIQEIIDQLVEVLRTTSTSLKYLHISLKPAELFTISGDGSSTRQYLGTKQVALMENILEVVPSVEYLSTDLGVRFYGVYYFPKSWKMVVSVSEGGTETRSREILDEKEFEALFKEHMGMSLMDLQF